MVLRYHGNAVLFKDSRVKSSRTKLYIETMETNKTFIQVIFPVSILFCLVAGFFPHGWLVTWAALIPVAVCFMDILELTASPELDSEPTSDWSELLNELAPPAPAPFRVQVAAPVWSGWLPLVAGVAAERGPDPLILFEVSWVTKSGRKSRKRVPQALVAKEFARLGAGGYTNVRVSRAVA